MSQVLPKLPAAARVPVEAFAFAHADPTPDAWRTSNPDVIPEELEASRISRNSHHPSLPPALANVGRYDVLGRIAVGGMAEIYLGREHLESGGLRHVAIKVLRPRDDGAVDKRYFEELFLREGRTAAQLVHPNICHVYEFGKWAGYFYIAMEWIEGSSLRTVLNRLKKREKAMPPTLAVGIAAQIAGALHYAHNVRDARRRPLRVVHLDVNPHNIMLRQDGVVKLLDFGIAQVADADGEATNDLLRGKLGYIAPEQARKQPLDRRVDVFGLGACLFEMLTGKPAYPRESLRESISALLTDPVPSIRATAPALPEELDQIVQKALAREPNDRFQTAGELQAALEGYLARSREVVSGRHVAQLMESLTPSDASKAPKLYTGPEVASRLAPVGATPTISGIDIDVVKRGQRRLFARAMVACVGVLLGVLAAYFFSGSPPENKVLPLETAAPAAIAPPNADAPEAQARERSEPPAALPAPAIEPPASAPPGSPLERKSKRAARRRAKTNFVADPGF